LATPRLSKLASGRRNTRQNPDGKQTTPVSDPEKILKTRGSLKPTTAVYQPKHTQPKAKIPLEMLTSQEAPTQTLFGETSAKTVEAETLNPNLAFPEIKSETHTTTSCVNEGENPSINLASIDIPSNSSVRFPRPHKVSKSIPYTQIPCLWVLPFTSLANQRNQVPRIPFPPFSVFSSPKEAKDSLYIFQNPLYNVPVSSPRISMAAVGGGGGGGCRRRRGGQGPPPPPRIFTKVAARYAPLVLPVPLHDLPENYMKNLPKFTGEGDLTMTEAYKFL
jgi:hypothetical protein